MSATARVLDFTSVLTPCTVRLPSPGVPGRVRVPESPPADPAPHPRARVPADDVRRAVRILNELRVQRDKRPHDYYTHPDLRDIPYMELKRIYREQEAAYEKEQTKKVKPAQKRALEGWDDMGASGEPELVRWLWQDKLPKGEFSILGGYEGSMKSTLAAKIVADITNGELEGELYGQPRTVLWFGGEESWSKAIMPRLIAAGADLERVRQIKPNAEHRSEKGRILNITEPGHVRALRAAIKKHDAALILFDPMTSHMGAKNVEKEEILRAVLEPLIDEVCHTDGVSMLAIKHFTKLDAWDPSKLLGGNRAWSQITRSFLAIAMHPDSDKAKPTEAAFIVGAQKANMTGDRTPLMFRPITVPVVIEGKQVGVPTIEWLGEAEYTPEEALRTRAKQEHKGAEPRVTARLWLKEYLDEKGPQTRRQVIIGCCNELKAKAFSDAAIDKAWKQLVDAGEGITGKRGKEALWSLSA